MTKQQAFDLMKTSVNMRHWNDNREIVKKEFGIKTDSYGRLISDIKSFLASPIPAIDSNGLIKTI